MSPRHHYLNTTNADNFTTNVDGNPAATVDLPTANANPALTTAHPLVTAANVNDDPPPTRNDDSAVNAEDDSDNDKCPLINVVPLLVLRIRSKVISPNLVEPSETKNHCGGMYL